MDSVARRFLLPVPEDDPKIALSATIFNYVCLGVIAFLAVAALGSIFIFVRKVTASISTVGVAILLFVAVSVSRRSSVRVGGALLTMGLWVAFAVQVWLAGGIDSIFASAYIAIIAIAGVLVGPSFAVIVAVLTVALAFGMTFLQSVGYVWPSYYPMPPWSAWSVLLFPVFLIVLTINGTLRAFAEAATRARREIETRQRAEGALRKAHDELSGRVKELHCLYGISQLVEKQAISLNETLQRIVDIIPASWRYPEVTCAKIDLRAREYKTTNFGQAVSKQTADIVVEGSIRGHLEVGYLEERPSSHEGPFFKEERSLINAVAERVGRILESKKAEEALLRSEELLAEAQSVARVGNWDWDSRTNEVSWSAEMFRIFGVTADEFKPDYEGHLKFIPPGDREGYERAIHECLSRKEPFAYEHRVATHGGHTKTVWGHGYVKLDDHGNPIGMHGTTQDITELKKTEAALRENQEKLETIFEASPAGILLVNPEGRITFANRKMSNLFSRACEHLLGTPYLDLVHPEQQRISHAKMKALMAGEIDHVSLERRYRAADGRAFVGHLSGRRLLRSDGGLDGLVGIITDITDRKKSEDELRESERKYRELFDGAPVGIFQSSVDGRVLSLNPAYARMFGYASPGEAILAIDNVAERLYVDPERRKTLIDRALGTEGFVKVENHYRKKDGSLFWGQLYFRVVRGRDGETKHLEGFVEDITERKIAEDALRSSEKAYRNLAENIPGIVYRAHFDNVPTMEFFNEVVESITGFKKEELRNGTVCSIDPLIVSEDRPRVVEFVKKACAEGAPFEIEYRILNKNGSVRHLLEHGRPIVGTAESPSFIDGVIFDVTDRKMAEEERHYLRDQLLQSQKMEAVGTMAGGIAHDFNNLLHIISGHAELLDMELAEKHMRFGEMAAIRQAAQRGADLVKQILTFSRNVDSAFELINLNDSVTNAVRLLYRTIPKMIAIELKLAERLRTVRADSTQIEQLLINLAVNAKDAMPEGGRLTIESRNVLLDEGYCKSHAELVPGQFVLLGVSDTGHGMEQEVLKHIFEPFFTTKGLADGTGLGLATVFGIVKMHGGHITCESQAGKGTAFEIYFPAARSDKGNAEEDQEAPAVQGGHETILVVDDEEPIRDLAKRILEKSGYSVLTAGSGKEGLAIYARHKSEISLVILDLIMPDMGGKQCLEELLKVNPQVKALIASGFAARGDTKTFLDNVAKGTVPKPFSMRELLRSVRHALDEINRIPS